MSAFDFIGIELGLDCLSELIALDEDARHERGVGFAQPARVMKARCSL